MIIKRRLSIIKTGYNWSSKEDYWSSKEDYLSSIQDIIDHSEWNYWSLTLPNKNLHYLCFITNHLGVLSPHILNIPLNLATKQDEMSSKNVLIFKVHWHHLIIVLLWIPLATCVSLTGWNVPKKLQCAFYPCNNI